MTRGEMGMLKSMTGFGSGDAENDSYKGHIEIKSVNQRYLDLNIYMPRMLNPFEGAIRQKIKAHAARGKVDVNLSFLDKREKDTCIRVDKSLAIAYHRALNEMSDLLHLARPDDVCEIAKYPEILKIEEQAADLTGAEIVLQEALDQAIVNFCHMREQEGTNLQADFEQRLSVLTAAVAQTAALAPAIVEQYRSRLQDTLNSLLSQQNIDETRIIQETAIYADKVNYTEEIVRLRSHFQQFEQIISEMDEPVGRKLDFLVQEMNREINTVASKANSVEAAKLVVDIKSEIEKIREQIQNVE